MTIKPLAGSIVVTAGDGDTINIAFTAVDGSGATLAKLSTGLCSAEPAAIESAVQKAMQAYLKSLHPTVPHYISIGAVLGAMDQGELDRWGM